MAGVEIQSLRLIEKDNSRRRRHHDIEEEKEKIFISGLDSYNRHHHTGSSSSQTQCCVPSNYIQSSDTREHIRKSLAGDDPLIEELPPYRRRNVGKSLTAYGKPLRLRGLTERVVSSSSSKKRDKEDSGHCSSSSSSEAGEDCRNLSICFLNETASEDEDEEEEDQKSEEHYNSLKIERVSAKSLVKGNISTKKGHVIIPINDTKKRDFLNSSSSSLSSSSHSPLPSPTKSPSSFPQQIKAIQDEAKRKLEVAKYIAAKTIANDRTQRRLNSPTCRILGLQYSKKLNRTILTDMNVAQLQIILNSFLSTIEGLNEDLVQFLILRDELAIEQDSLLTDIEDITQSLRLEF
nr:schwannomin-interacting protein 1-like [Lepeophtheirus salmonis]